MLGGFSLPLPLRWAREIYEFLLSLSGGVACDTSTRTGGTGEQNICVTLSLPVQNVTAKLKPLNMEMPVMENNLCSLGNLQIPEFGFVFYHWYHLKLQGEHDFVFLCM